MGSDSGLDHTAFGEDSSAEAESSPDPEPTMPVASVARRLGVAPSTLRTWDRRYGLGPSKHTGGRHRRYRAADIDRLELMQRALLQGASTAEAARYALEKSPKREMAEFGMSTGAVRTPEKDESSFVSNKNQRIDAFEVDGDATPLLARRLSRAALAMDVDTVRVVLARVVKEAGVFSSWQAVIQPVLIALASRTDRVRAQDESEYLFSECVLAALIRATPILGEPRNPRPVFLCRVPGEEDGGYPLPLYALAACLAERGIDSQLVGRSAPSKILTAIIRRVMPAAVVLFSSRESTADGGLFEIPNQSRHRNRLFAYGEGWNGRDLPSKVESLPDFASAVERVEHVLVGFGRSVESAPVGFSS